MKTAVMCWCLFSIALAWPVPEPNLGNAKGNLKIGEDGEIHPDRQALETHAEAPKTEQDVQINPTQQAQDAQASAAPKPEMDHPSPTARDNTSEKKNAEIIPDHQKDQEAQASAAPKPEQDNPSPADSESQATSKSTRAVHMPNPPSDVSHDTNQQKNSLSSDMKNYNQEGDQFFDEGDEMNEPEVSFLEEESNQVAEQQIPDESKSPDGFLEAYEEDED